ncbi:MAG: M24 family metallopeptidase [Candidatus Thermoplasmatota archaeon]|nr:M24 family metallopeptidase [Candidatus Thermoplasmatota archaeon]
MEAGEIRKFEEAGKLGKKALELALSLIEPGTLLFDVAQETEQFIIENGGKPAFPLNLSIDNDAAHYTPFTGDKLKFKTGQLVKVDIGAQVDGYPSDNAATIEVGDTGKHSDLVDASREALAKAIRSLRPRMKLGSIGSVIGNTIQSYGFKPIKNLGGHGIDRYDLMQGCSSRTSMTEMEERWNPILSSPSSRLPALVRE